MYLEHYGLREPPFRLTPHTDVFFEGAGRGATLEALVHAVLHGEGIVKVSGEVGSGKTMLCRMLAERLPAHVVTIFLANPSYSREEILYAIAEELRLPLAGARPAQVLRELQERLIALYSEGRRAVLLVDEAHAMPAETLEEVRLLSNLEARRDKLLQIVLFGQPELDEMLARPQLRQLRDRITHAFRMRPLAREEVAAYLAFRMRAAGYRGPDVFTAGAVELIARASEGLTRRIHVLADKALLAAFVRDLHVVTPREVRRAIADAQTIVAARRRGLRVGLWAVTLGAGLAAAALAWVLPRAGPQPAAGARQAQPPTDTAPAAVLEPPPSARADAPPVAAATAQPPETPERRLGPAQRRHIERYASAGHKLVQARIAHAIERLEAEPDGHHSIELFVSDNSDPARIERFLVRAGDLVEVADLLVIPIASGSRYRVRVTYGVYPDRESAEAAARRLPPKYRRAFQTQPRSFAALRAAL